MCFSIEFGMKMLRNRSGKENKTEMKYPVAGYVCVSLQSPLLLYEIEIKQWRLIKPQTHIYMAYVIIDNVLFTCCD